MAAQTMIREQSGHTIDIDDESGVVPDHYGQIELSQLDDIEDS